jgi:gamma-glutamylaminecyclotransferase
MRVFVYGTLKRGCSNHHFLKGQQFIATGISAPEYALYDLGGYPGMVRTEDAPQAIEGEIWEVSAECLALLDELEAIAEGEYERVWLPTLEAWGYIYTWPVEGMPRVQSWPSSWAHC